MENIKKLTEIANAINAKDLEKELFNIKDRSLQTNANLIFPLVGEFSSGKTTLINALTDSKKLETATEAPIGNRFQLVQDGVYYLYGTTLSDITTFCLGKMGQYFILLYLCRAQCT